MSRPRVSIFGPHPLLTVVMPVYNEAGTVGEIVERVLAVPLRIELIAVDDASTDGSRDTLQELSRGRGFKLLVQDKDPPLAAWIAAGGFDVVLLPARRRPLRSAKHPAADQLRKSTSAEVHVVDAGYSFEEPPIAAPHV